MLLRTCFLLLLVLLAKLSLSNSTAQEEYADLIPYLQQAAGVYKDPARRGALNKTVIVTATNHGYMNHLMNFKCYMDRLGMQFIVISLDRYIYDHIKNHTSMITYHLGAQKVGEVTHLSTSFRNHQFNLITAKKKETVHIIISLGFDVIFTDVDVAIIKDPIDRMMWQNVDYAHSLNCVCEKGFVWDFYYKSRLEGNTGFYYVRSNNRTIALWQAAYEESMKQSKLDDQAVFWTMIRRMQNPHVTHIGKCADFNRTDSNRDELVACMLDTCEFSSGMISRYYVPEFTYDTLVYYILDKNVSMYTVHANYIKGNKSKMQKLFEHGLWLAMPENNFKIVSNVSEIPHFGSNASGAMVPANLTFDWDALDLGTTKWLNTCYPFVEPILVKPSYESVHWRGRRLRSNIRSTARSTMMRV